MKAYHKTFGEIEILLKDNTTTTIVVLATGEEKKLLNKFADMLISYKPFIKAKKVVSIKKELTQADKDIVAQSVANEMKKMYVESGQTAEQRQANAKYRQAGSSLR
jgi:hypothetical protein